MKILTPIMSSRDIDILNPQEYGTEFFCGYLPQWWIEEFNDPTSNRLSTPINNRNAKSANVTTLEELCSIASKSLQHKTDTYVVLNAKHYPDSVYKYIDKYIDEIVSAGIVKLIVCDIGMIRYLEKKYPQIVVSVSCLNQTTNSMAVKFYSHFRNVKRIVFPRHMSSEEIEKIALQFPEMSFEYFIFSNKCLYDDGYCRGIHEFTPICKDLFYSDFFSRTFDALNENEQQLLRINEFEFSLWTRNYLNSERRGYCTPNFGCTACSLVKLAKCNNIDSVKISIRGHDVSERLRQVQMAHSIIKCVAAEGSIEDVKEIVSKMYGKEDLCKSGMGCIMI